MTDLSQSTAKELIFNVELKVLRRWRQLPLKRANKSAVGVEVGEARAGAYILTHAPDTQISGKPVTEEHFPTLPLQIMWSGHKKQNSVTWEVAQDLKDACFERLPN